MKKLKKKSEKNFLQKSKEIVKKTKKEKLPACSCVGMDKKCIC